MNKSILALVSILLVSVPFNNAFPQETIQSFSESCETESIGRDSSPPLQQKKKWSAPKTLLIPMAAGTGAGFFLAGLFHESCLDCMFRGAAVGGSGGALLGLASVIWNQESPSQLERGIAGGMVGLVAGALGGALIGQRMEVLEQEGIDAGEDGGYCKDEDCALLGAMIGSGLGMVAGVVLGVIDPWGDAPKGKRLDVDFYPQRNTGFAVRALVRF